MTDEFILVYLLLFSISFYSGAWTARKNRGRYLDKPIYDFVSTSIVKIIIAITGVSSYLFLLYTSYQEINNSLLAVSFISLIPIIMYCIALLIQMQIDKKDKKNNKEKSDDDKNNKVDDSVNEIVSIMATAISNGYLVVLIFFTVIIVCIKSFIIFGYEIDTYIKTTTFANVYILMFFNSILLLFFSLVQFYRYYYDNKKSVSKKGKDFGSIENYLKQHVDN